MLFPESNLDPGVRWQFEKFRVRRAVAEIDPAQPRVPGTGIKARFRHYVNLRRTEPRLRRLLRDFRWRRMDEVFLAPETAAVPAHVHQASMRYAS